MLYCYYLFLIIIINFVMLVSDLGHECERAYAHITSPIRVFVIE
jgi:hypothetical protein